MVVVLYQPHVPKLTAEPVVMSGDGFFSYALYHTNNVRFPSQGCGSVRGMFPCASSHPGDPTVELGHERATVFDNDSSGYLAARALQHARRGAHRASGGEER